MGIRLEILLDPARDRPVSKVATMTPSPVIRVLGKRHAPVSVRVRRNGNVVSYNELVQGVPVAYQCIDQVQTFY